MPFKIEAARLAAAGSQRLSRHWIEGILICSRRCSQSQARVFRWQQWGTGKARYLTPLLLILALIRMRNDTNGWCPPCLGERVPRPHDQRRDKSGAPMPPSSSSTSGSAGHRPTSSGHPPTHSSRPPEGSSGQPGHQQSHHHHHHQHHNHHHQSSSRPSSMPQRPSSSSVKDVKPSMGGSGMSSSSTHSSSSHHQQQQQSHSRSQQHQHQQQLPHPSTQVWVVLLSRSRTEFFGAGFFRDLIDLILVLYSSATEAFWIWESGVDESSPAVKQRRQWEPFFSPKG